MELKECLDILQQIKGRYFNIGNPMKISEHERSKSAQAIEIAISFCETALKLQESKGMPQNVKSDRCLNHCDICETPDCNERSRNETNAEWTAWLVSRVNKENIIKVMDSIKYRENWQGIPKLNLGEIMTDDDIQILAAAIVKDILGKE